MTNEDAYYLGWAEALLYAQAHNDVEGGQQTLTTHLPAGEEIYAFWDPTDHRPPPEHPPLPIFNPAKLEEAIYKLNDECMITDWRFLADISVWGRKNAAHIVLKIEIGSSEGHHGSPRWYDEEDGIVGDPTTTGGQS